MYPRSLRISRESYALPRTSSSTLFSLAWRLWWSGRRSGWRRGRRIGCTGGMEGQHVALHAKLDPAHAVRRGFLQGPSITPAVVCDAVAGDDRAGAVRPPAAVHEYGARGVVQQGERLRGLLIGWRMDAAERHVDIMHSGRLDRLLFRLAGMLACRAQVDDGLDPQLGQADPAFALGLRATVDPLVHLAEVRDARRGRLAGPYGDGKGGMAGDNQQCHPAHDLHWKPNLYSVY